LCKTKIRDDDILARYGESKFAILLPNTSKEAGIKTGERIHKVVYQSFMVTGRTNILITISLGITFGEFEKATSTTFARLQEQAEKALILAKESGGNRIEVLSSSDQVHT
jgi:diguanylate cyclase (GGDEF)-like protein